VTRFFETSVHVWTTRRHIPEDSNISHCGNWSVSVLVALYGLHYDPLNSRITLRGMARWQDYPLTLKMEEIRSSET
jgi:hypothetical protein